MTSLHGHYMFNSLSRKQRVNFNKLPPYFSLRNLYKSMSSYPSLILEDYRDKHYFLNYTLHAHNTFNSFNWKQKVSFNKLPLYFFLQSFLYKSMHFMVSILDLINLEDCRDEHYWKQRVNFYQLSPYFSLRTLYKSMSWYHPWCH